MNISDRFALGPGVPGYVPRHGEATGVVHDGPITASGYVRVVCDGGVNEGGM